MTTGYLAALLSAGTQLPACALTLCGLIGSHLLLPAPVQETKPHELCPQPCCAVSLQAGVEERFGVQFAGSSEK